MLKFFLMLAAILVLVLVVVLSYLATFFKIHTLYTAVENAENDLNDSGSTRALEKYNSAASEFNAAISHFPTSLIARSTGMAQFPIRTK